MTDSTKTLLAELRAPRNDFPTYFTDLCARAADEIENLNQSRLSDIRETLTSVDGLPNE